MAEYILNHSGAQLDDAAQKRHEHLNQSLLDGITAEKTGEWDAKLTPERTVNGKPLSSDISLTAQDVGALPSDWQPDLSDLGVVPATRTVNGKALSEDVSLTAEDVGACRVDLAPEELAALGSLKHDIIQIPASKWQEDVRTGWYFYSFTIPNLSVHDQIDIAGIPAMIDGLSSMGVRYLLCCNSKGKPYAYAYGAKPTKPVAFYYSTRPVIHKTTSEIYGCGISAPELVTG